MFNLTFGIRALLMSAFLVLAGNVVQNIYIPTQAVKLGMSPFAISLLGSFYFVGFLAGCIYMPRFLYAVGHIRTFASFAALAAISSLIISMSDNPSVWIFCRLISGICLSGLYLSIESWISGFSNSSNRGRIISIYRTVDILGSLAGQVFLFQIFDSPHILNYVVILFLLSFLPISLTKVQAPLLIKANRESLMKTLKKTYQLAPLSLIAVLFTGVTSGVFWSMIAVFTSANLIAPEMNPVIASAYLIGGALVQWPLGIWSDKVDRRKVILLSSLIGFVATTIINILVFKGELQTVQLLVLVAIFGAGGIPIYSLAVAHANDWVSSESLVGLSVLLLVSSSIGSVLGPLVAGSFFHILEIKFLFFYMTISHGFIFLISSYRIIIQPGADQSKKSEYQTLSVTTAALASSFDKENK